MNKSTRSFTCYFCNQLIENETQMGHTAMCSKVLLPCPFSCGAYIQRADLNKHKSECTNNNRKSVTFDSSSLKRQNNTNSLGRNQTDSVSNIQKRLADIEIILQKPTKTTDQLNIMLKDHSQNIQKLKYFMGIMSEWKKKIDTQMTTIENRKEIDMVQEKLMQLQTLLMEFTMLKDAFYKESMISQQVNMDVSKQLDDIRITFNKQSAGFEAMWRDQTGIIQNIYRDLNDIKNSVDEQKAKHAGLIFDLKAISQIASESSEKVEILERDYSVLKQELNQMKVNLEILEDLNSSENSNFQRLLWRITEIESKLKRAKENDIVLKSPIFYTHQYGYKIRLLLYLNGLNKWKDRYALACIHVLKGEYDLLLQWPCVIDGNIVLKDLEGVQKKDFSKYFKTKRSRGDEDEDEPQESSSTYIFIPHNVLLKGNHLKNDTLFLDICINDNQHKYETSL